MRLPNSFILCLFCLSGQTTLAQSDDTWQQEASERLKDIYERGVFRAPGVSASWNADSQAYRVRERDPQSGRMVTAEYRVDSGERTVVEPQPGVNNRVSPDGSHRLEVRRGSVFLVGADDQRQKLTDAADRDIFVKDIHWNDSGEFVCFVQVDRTDVKLRSVLVPGDPSYPGVAENRFARVGGKLETLRVGIASADGRSFHFADLPQPDEGMYLGQVDWVPGSSELLVETLSRFRDTRDFYLVSSDGSATRIYTETNEAWAIGSQYINSGAHWIQDGKAFIYITEQDGWRQAWVCSRDGNVEYKITPGEYDIIDRAFVDEANRSYYFYASPENGTQKYLHRVGLGGEGKLERITPADQPGTHDYVISPDGQYAVHTYSTLNDPPVIDLVELPSHKVIRSIDDRSELRKKFRQVVPQRTEFVTIDIGNDIQMDACVTKPRDFNPEKKYPVFVYVYGEPYSQTVLDRWGAGQTDFHRVVADTGYVVVSIDNRGTHCPKGAAWRRSIFGSLGPLSTEEQAAALQKLAEMKPYLDLSRVGIWGWSGGGSNTLNALFRKPDVYHVGIAVVPKPQPHLYNAWFQEIYMRTPEVNPDGYQKSAPINFAEGLKGKLLIVTGSGETNTHIQIIEGLVDKLIELGKPFDYMVYPNRDHGLREGRGTVVHVRMLILRYLIEHLPRGPR
ncbi:MAG: S9 family peptidase [Planctomycetaceae bacterium]|nr:S9 family peptidase [Planctomycetaceae bacterium]